MFAVQLHREVGPGSWLVKAYRITTPFWAESGKEERGDMEIVTQSAGGGGVAFAVQPHREVRPESGLVGIAEHIVVNKR